MIKSKKLRNKIINTYYPLTLLTMKPMRTEMSIETIDITIEYDNGSKYIQYDFYKRISTVKEP